MFVQILDFLAQLVGLLKDRKVLADAAKRKRIGNAVIDIHQTLGHLALNADKIKFVLHNALSKSPLEVSHVYQLRLLLIEHHRKLIDFDMDCSKARIFIDVYGQGMNHHIHSLNGQKLPMLQFVLNLLHQEDAHIVIPKRLDFRIDLEEFGFSWDFSVMNELYRKKDSIVQSLPLPTLFEVADPSVESLRPALELFQKEVERLDAGPKYREIQSSLAGVLREHFKLEELL